MPGELLIMAQPVIESLLPGAGIEGGEVVITCRDFTFSTYDQARVKFDGAETRPISTSPNRVIAPVPSGRLIQSGEIQVTLEANGASSEG
ncbi:MAG TPA: IPT/TIG domain-containing protein, partial [Blastocatellia bacterium]